MSMCRLSLKKARLVGVAEGSEKGKRKKGRVLYYSELNKPLVMRELRVFPPPPHPQLPSIGKSPVRHNFPNLDFTLYFSLEMHALKPISC